MGVKDNFILKVTNGENFDGPTYLMKNGRTMMNYFKPATLSFGSREAAKAFIWGWTAGVGELPGLAVVKVTDKIRQGRKTKKGK